MVQYSSNDRLTDIKAMPFINVSKTVYSLMDIIIKMYI